MKNNELDKLDPKLREAYNRIMQTPIEKTGSHQPTQPDIAQATPSTHTLPAKNIVEANNQNDHNSHRNGYSTLFIILGILFFAAYAVFWIKLLGL